MLSDHKGRAEQNRTRRQPHFSVLGKWGLLCLQPMSSASPRQQQDVRHQQDGSKRGELPPNLPQGRGEVWAERQSERAAGQVEA